MKEFEIFKINCFVLIEFEVLNQFNTKNKLENQKYHHLLFYNPKDDKQKFENDEQFMKYIQSYILENVAPDLNLDVYSSVYTKSIKICKNTADINKAIKFEIELYKQRMSEMEFELQSMLTYQWFISDEKVTL